MVGIRNIYDFGVRKLKRIKNNLRFRKQLSCYNYDKTMKDKIIEYNLQRKKGCDTTICHLPLRSLYFGFNGIVTACCFNRFYHLGKFPKNSIEEIIHSEKRKQLQLFLNNTDFSHGCHNCKEMISSRNYSSVGASFGDTLPDNGDLPTEMIFELDNTCNLKCMMCNAEYSSAHNGGIRNCSPYDSEEFINQLKPFIPTLHYAKFLGGEPFLSDIYPKIWKEIREINPKCTIRLQTNGTVLTDSIKSTLENGNFLIGLSIDTINPEHYKEIRNGASLETTLKNLDFFDSINKKHGDYTYISVCPMKQNRFDIPELVDFCNNKGFFINFNNVKTEGFTLNELSEQELNELCSYYKSNNHKGNNHIARTNYETFSCLIRRIESLKATARENEEKRIKEEYLNEYIPCTRDELVKSLNATLVQKPDFKYDASIFDLIPESFMIKRRDFLYVQNEKKLDSIIEILSMPKDDLPNIIEKIFISSVNRHEQ